MTGLIVPSVPENGNGLVPIDVGKFARTKKNSTIRIFCDNSRNLQTRSEKRGAKAAEF